jgi:excisionase family DNA binding protein
MFATRDSQTGAQIADMVWTVREAARRLKVSDRTLRKRVRQGVIPHIRFGGENPFPGSRVGSMDCKTNSWGQ